MKFVGTIFKMWMGEFSEIVESSKTL